MKRLLPVFIALLSFVFPIQAQDNQPETEQLLGGIDLDIKNQIFVEQALVGVYYEFHRPRLLETLDEVYIDTLLLALGNSNSIYLDPLYKERMEIQRKGRWDRSKKAKGHNMEYETIDGISDLLSMGHGYTEDSPGHPVQVYKDRMKGHITSVYNSYVDNVKLEEDLEEMSQWEMSEETDSIMGYLCYGAKITFRGRNYTAWYTPDIPIHDGPWKFHGLPGLILKITDDQDLLSWVAIGLQRIKTNIMIDNADYEIITDHHQFNNFVTRESNTHIVEFFVGDILYHSSNKVAPFSIPIEL